MRLPDDCRECGFSDSCPDHDCQIYQDLKAEYEYEMREDMRNAEGN